MAITDGLEDDYKGDSGRGPAPSTQNSVAGSHLKRRVRLMVGLLFLLIVMGINIAISSGKVRFEEVISESMEDTLLVGDVLLCDGTALVDRYAIVVVEDPEEAGGKLVKRVMGMPGDRIRIDGGVLYIRRLGETKFREEYSELIKGNHMIDSDGQWTVPDDMIFLMGDNRNNSADSRVFGPVPLKSVRGVVERVIWPFDHMHRPPEMKDPS